MNFTIIELLFIVGLLLIIIYNFFQLYKLYKDSLILNKTPVYNKALVGNYVKFKGKIVSLNRYQPSSMNTYEFYIRIVLGFFKRKKKKPSNEYYTVSEKVDSYKTDEFLLSDGRRKVFVALNSFPSYYGNNFKHKLKMNKKVTSENMLNLQLERNYSHFLIKEYFLEEGDFVTVYGKLVQSHNKFIITDTYSDKLPFFILLGNHIPLKIFTKITFIDKFLSIFITIIILLNLEAVSEYFLFFFLFGWFLFRGIIKTVNQIYSYFKELL